MTQNEEYTTTGESIEEVQKKIVTGVLMALEGVFSEATNKVSDSLALYDIGTETEIVKTIKKTIQSPLSNITQVYDSIHKTVNDLKARLIISFVKARGKLVDFAAYTHDENATHVFLGLKKDSEDDRDEFYSLLNSYESNKISNSFPIIFHFINRELLGEVCNVQMISIDEQQASESMHS